MMLLIQDIYVQPLKDEKNSLDKIGLEKSLDFFKTIFHSILDKPNF